MAEARHLRHSPKSHVGSHGDGQGIKTQIPTNNARQGSKCFGLRSIYILDSIDDPALRQDVQKALKPGEPYHRLRRAISYVDSGRFRVKTEAEQQIWNECSRLVANAIVYYNTFLLSRVCERKAAAGDLAALEILKSISPSPGAMSTSSATST